MLPVLVNVAPTIFERSYVRLDAIADAGVVAPSSASLPRLRPPVAGRPRFADDMLGCNGELSMKDQPGQGHSCNRLYGPH